MRANREDLAHVLDNLLDNALRYSPPGTKVRVETDIDGDRALLMSRTLALACRPRTDRAYSSASTEVRAAGGPVTARASV